MKKTLLGVTALTLATVLGSPALAQSQGDMTLAFEHFIRGNLGLEVLAATPFSHDLFSSSVYIGSTKHLPPTISLNYHIPTGGSVTPFICAGINYTVFFSE